MFCLTGASSWSPRTASSSAVQTGLVMPILGGADLAASVTKLRPDVPIVFMSGYIDHADARHQVRDSRFFVQKPFRAEELIAALSDAVRELQAS